MTNQRLVFRVLSKSESKVDHSNPSQPSAHTTNRKETLFSFHLSDFEMDQFPNFFGGKN